MDLDGTMTPWCGVEGVMPISLEVQRAIKRAEMWAFYMALCKLCGRSEIFSGNQEVVQVMNKGEVNSDVAGQNDADLWVLGLE